MYYLAKVSQEMLKKVLDGTFEINNNYGLYVKHITGRAIQQLWNGSYVGNFVGLFGLARMKVDNRMFDLDENEITLWGDHCWGWNSSIFHTLNGVLNDWPYYNQLMKVASRVATTSSWDRDFSEPFKLGACFKKVRDLPIPDSYLFILNKMSKFVDDAVKNIVLINS